MTKQSQISTKQRSNSRQSWDGNTCSWERWQVHGSSVGRTKNTGVRVLRTHSWNRPEHAGVNRIAYCMANERTSKLFYELVVLDSVYREVMRQSAHKVQFLVRHEILCGLCFEPVFGCCDCSAVLALRIALTMHSTLLQLIVSARVCSSASRYMNMLRVRCKIWF